MNSKPKVDICMSPHLYPFYRMDDSVVVVVDIFRATSAFCTAFEYGVESIMPLADVEMTRQQRDNGSLIAGERDGFKLEGFDFGNSPYDFMHDNLAGRQIAFTTTNGTQAINRVKDDSDYIVMGSFLNISALVDWLIKQNRDVLLLCAGWKNTVNIEDTLFAGSVAARLLEKGMFSSVSDSVAMARNLYRGAGDDLLSYLCQTSPLINMRMSLLGKDFAYCLKHDKNSVIPIYKNGLLKNVNKIK